MLKGKLSMFIIFSLIIAVTGASGVFLALNLNKANKVDKKQIEFNIEGATKEYDGTPLELSSLTLVDETSLPSGYTYDFICNDTITNVGEIYPNPSIVIYDREGKNVTDYYNCVIKDNGGLRVKPRELTVTFKETTKRYDGTPLNKADYIIDGELVFGHRLNPVFKSEATEVDEPVNIVADVWVVDMNGSDVSRNYMINDNLSGEDIPTFIIRGRVLTIELRTIEKVYDGLEFSKDDITSDDYSCSGLDTDYGHTVIIKDFVCEDEIINVRSTDYSFTIPTDQIEVVDENGREVTSEYEIKVKPGKIRIKPREIVLTELIKEEVYFDGIAHRLELTESMLNSLLSQEDKEALGSSKIISVEAGSFIEAGEYPCNLVIEKSNGDIDTNFTIDSEQAKLIIKKRTVKFTKKANATTEKKFNPSNYNLFIASDIYETSDTAFEYLISFKENAFNEPKEYLANELLEIIATNLSIEYKDNIIYDIEEVKLVASVTVDKITFKIKDSIKLNDYDYEKTFDGKAVKASEIFDLTSDIRAYLAANKYSLEYDFDEFYEFKNVGYQTIDLTEELLVARMYDEYGSLVMAYSEDKCEIYTEEGYEEIGIRIKVLKYSFSTGSAEKTYDGTKLECLEYEIFGLPEGFSSSREWNTDVTYYTDEYGELNIMTFKILYGTEVVTDNCEIDYDACSYGRLIVKKASLVIDIINTTITYGDYTNPANIPVSSTKSGTAIGLPGISVSIIPSISLDAGDHVINENSVYIQYSTLDPDSIDVAINPGKVTIKKKAVTIQSQSFSKVYDGNSISRPSYIDGYSVYYEEDNIVNAGTYQNIFYVTGIDSNNYEITKIYGTITISPKKIVLQSGDLLKEYDGESFLNRDNYLYDLNSGEDFYVNYTSSPINAGTYTNAFVITDTSNNYDVTYIYGTLTITPKKIVVMTNSITTTQSQGISYSDYEITVPGESLDMSMFTIVSYMYYDGNTYQIGEFDNIVYINSNNYEVVSYIYGKITIN